MTAWKAKRFWKESAAMPEAAGFGVRLDGRAVKTPAKCALVMPTLAMAQAVAAEWDAQTGEIKPESMPVTRSANAAIDKVAVQHDEVVALIAAYGETDLLCYRAEHPAVLIERQAAAWDPVLEWAETGLNAPLRVGQGVVFVPQPPESLSRLTALVKGFTPFGLTALHDLVALSGSLVLGLAVAAGRLPAQVAWDMSRMDERWQAEQWGRDEEAEAAEAFRYQGFTHASRFLLLCGPGACGDLGSTA
ncbi:MAG: ATP12 family protein [Gemmobacter sp.]|nr:ATP12 family protein [Gemmobacter sp.]